ncbi:MAG TPA: LysM domain-containing protein [Lacipirellulaceae bacterium]|nr:LysM domain-containing protein [Lacipirellulaceae bacterium]
MSSLRPLATIALLAAVGVFLYMKINESEPKLPPELAQWSTSELEVGGDFEAPLPTFGAAPAASAAQAVGGDAPPYAAAAAAPWTPPAPAGGDAAPWTPPATSPAAAVVPGVAPAPPVDASPTARTADPAAVAPPMPPLPGGGDAPVAATEFAPATEAPRAADTAAIAAAAVAAAAAPVEEVVQPAPAETPTTPTTPTGGGPASMFAAARVAVQGALDRGELAQALLLLSDWYGDPSLSPQETREVNDLLSQLAGSVIYEGPPAHRLEPPYVVQSGETLESIAAKFDIPWQLLAKINGLSPQSNLAPGQELKVVRGPFSALVDLSQRKMTLMLDRRYAGVFKLEVDPALQMEEGTWKVDQKLLTPTAGGPYGAEVTEDRSLLLANLADPGGPTAIVRGPGGSDPTSFERRGRELRLSSGDIGDVFDILSIGSRITIRR